MSSDTEGHGADANGSDAVRLLSERLIHIVNQGAHEQRRLIHDVRSKMTGVLGNLQLQSLVHGPDGPDGYLSRAQHSAEALVALTDEYTPGNEPDPPRPGPATGTLADALTIAAAMADAVGLAPAAPTFQPAELANLRVAVDDVALVVGLVWIRANPDADLRCEVRPHDRLAAELRLAGDHELAPADAAAIAALAGRCGNTLERAPEIQLLVGRSPAT